ncbi:MAG: hypothetical protein AB7F35_17515 [Acetobacteraceae bacterium]
MAAQSAAVSLDRRLRCGFDQVQLGRRDLSFVAEAVAAVVSDWSVEFAGASDEDAVVVVMPDGADDKVGPTFMLRRTGAAVELEQVHWDQHANVATLPTLTDAVRSLQAHLCALTSPTYRTRH